MNYCKLWMEFTQFPNGSNVILLTDRFEHEGIAQGSFGQIIEAGEDEFYTVAFPSQIIVRGDEITLAEN